MFQGGVRSVRGSLANYREGTRWSSKFAAAFTEWKEGSTCGGYLFIPHSSAAEALQDVATTATASSDGRSSRMRAAWEGASGGGLE